MLLAGRGPMLRTAKTSPQVIAIKQPLDGFFPSIASLFTILAGREPMLRTGETRPLPYIYIGEYKTEIYLLAIFPHILNT